MNGVLLLEEYLRRWEQRWRLQRLMGWLPRALALAGAAGSVGVLLAWVVGVQPLTAAALAVGAALLTASGWLLHRVRRPLARAARCFEHEWALQERLSTALEVASGRIPAEPLGARVVQDALRVAQAVDVQARMPLPLDRRSWLLAALTGLLLIGLLLVPPPRVDAPPPLSAAAQAAVDAAADVLAQMIVELSQDTTLAPTLREGLLAVLESRLATLKEEALSVEAAFAAVSEAQNALANAAQEMAAQAQVQADVLSTAAQAFLRERPDSSLPRSQTLSEALRAQGASPPSTAAEAQARQQQAQQAADALRQPFPALAAALDQAASADTPEAFSAALDQAQQQAQQAESQQQRQQQAAAAMQQRSLLAQQQAEALARSEADPSAAAQMTAADTPDEAERSSGDEGSSGQEGGQTAAAETGQAQSGAGEQAQGQPDGSEGMAEAEAQASAAEGSRGEAQAAGEAASDQEATGFSAGGRQSSPGDGEGEASPPVIFIGEPDRVIGAEPLLLPGDPGSAPARPADVLSLPEGGQLVPYTQLLDRYLEQAGRALEADVVPRGLADFIRSYFSELSR